MRKLTEPFLVTGKVIPGDQQGRTIGFPTANLDVDLDPAQLAPGVYKSICTIGESADQEKNYVGLAYFGPRLVFGEKRNNFEVFLVDFSGSLYEQTLQVELTHFIREPLPFESMEKLKIQLEDDLAQAQNT